MTDKKTKKSNTSKLKTKSFNNRKNNKIIDNDLNVNSIGPKELIQSKLFLVIVIVALTSSFFTLLAFIGVKYFLFKTRQNLPTTNEDPYLYEIDETIPAKSTYIYEKSLKAMQKKSTNDIDTSTWKTFECKERGITFKYPKNFIIKTSPDEEGAIITVQINDVKDNETNEPYSIIKFYTKNPSNELKITDSLQHQTIIMGSDHKFKSLTSISSNSKEIVDNEITVQQLAPNLFAVINVKSISRNGKLILSIPQKDIDSANKLLSTVHVK